MLKRITGIQTLWFLFFSLVAHTSPNRPLPGDGTSYALCDVSSTQDTSPPAVGSLRQRVQLYNRSIYAQTGLCTAGIFFLFNNRTITLSQPLVLENNPHTRSGGIRAGTQIDGYDNDGEKIGIIIDALRVTENDEECAFKIKGGMAARQQIRGLTLLVHSWEQAICDENGHNLLSEQPASCLNSDPEPAHEEDCHFADLTLIVPAPPPVMMPLDSDHDGIIDDADRCPHSSRKFPVNRRGCTDRDQDGVPDTEDLCPTLAGVFKNAGCPLPQASGGISGSGGILGMSGSGGMVENLGSGGIQAGSGGAVGGSGGNQGTGGNNTGGSGGSSGISGSGGGMSGTSGGIGGTAPTPARSGREPDPFGCSLIMTPTNL